MKVVISEVTLSELKSMAETGLGSLVKAIVDVELGIMAVDAELHADQEACLLGQGSAQENLWGINLYPNLPRAEWVELDSMINLRPSQGNRTRGVDSLETRAKILAIIEALVTR